MFYSFVCIAYHIVQVIIQLDVVIHFSLGGGVHLIRDGGPGTGLAFEEILPPLFG